MRGKREEKEKKMIYSCFFIISATLLILRTKASAKKGENEFPTTERRRNEVRGKSYSNLKRMITQTLVHLQQ
jgi:hypothetical protein